MTIGHQNYKHSMNSESKKPTDIIEKMIKSDTSTKAPPPSKPKSASELLTEKKLKDIVSGSTVK